MLILGLLITLAGACPSEKWTYSSYNDMCYLFPDLKLSWSDAKAYCTKIGSDLLSPVNSQELTLPFYDRFNEKQWNLYPPWIDLSFGTSEFLWNGKTRATFTKWLASEPTDIEQCVVWRTLNDEEMPDGWKSLLCKYEQPVVCQQPTKTCKTQVFTSPRGRITSMAFPQNYDNNLSCYYHIVARAGFQITLLIREFYIEANRDTLQIYDGANTTTKLLASKTGRSKREVYRSTGNSMTLLFTTDNSITKGGWSISYQFR